MKLLLASGERGSLLTFCREMMRFLVYLQIDGWLLGLASLVALAVYIRRREIGFAFLAVAICAWFTSRAIAAWIFANSSHMAPTSNPLVAIARTCELWIGPMLLVAGLLLLVRRSAATAGNK
jgi:hypothetical protein